MITGELARGDETIWRFPDQLHGLPGQNQRCPVHDRQEIASDSVEAAGNFRRLPDS